MPPALPVILIVDDDSVSVMALRRALRKLGVVNSVAEARDGAEALDWLRARRGAPAILLLDVNMPRMNGIEFLGALSTQPSPPEAEIFLMVTADTPDALAQDHRDMLAGRVHKDDLPDSLGRALGGLGDAVGYAS